MADNLGQEIIKDKAQQIYEGLSDECKEQVIQYQNGASIRFAYLIGTAVLEIRKMNF